ncbi:multidrug/Oligosaccharidyl-lipid/Polysaccharide flippase [Mycena alexandri]|uniref:Multidrug/Oligosaccharidyl-lipid/Polysaccharide flippase n=1 Tax=Mycena alexandri TaxID=1745969 RepID=A0AAD6X2H3_9AGAR|nr:multidrug/Oligosaccharidyl-lipid/Polysaccharide flippase [Mycena alexandri]KAJ7032436.1 multidrug/Oligosaccharidyl-lipid/Polysaccharide flippase [Mycena alexandri]
MSEAQLQEGLLPPESETTPLLNPSTTNKNPSESKTALYLSELRVIAKYSLPIFGTQLLEYSLVIAPVLTIGHLPTGTTALAGVTLGSMTATVSSFSVLHGLASALDTVLPSAWTSPQPKLVGLWSQRMAVIMTAALIPMYLIWFNAETILLGLKQDPEVARLASIYLRWVSFGLPAYAFNLISRRYFQSQGLFAVPTQIICIIAPVNALLNYLLIWGPDPIRLGYIGAPIATACSFNLVSLLNICYGVFYAPRTAWHPLSRRALRGLGVLARLGLSGVGQTAAEWWAFELVALAASLLGPISLATQSILLTSASTTYQAPFALGIAASVRIGNLLGEFDSRRAQIAANTALMMALTVGLVFCAMFMGFRSRWAYLFNDDPVVIQLVSAILPWVALFQIFDGVNGVAGGILRARGKQMTGAMLNLSAYYLIGIPLGVYLAFTLKLELHGLWIALAGSLLYCAAFGTLLCVRTNWDGEVRKVVARIDAERVKAGGGEDTDTTV